MALFRVDFSGRGELAERQQKLAQMLSRLQKISEGRTDISDKCWIAAGILQFASGKLLQINKMPIIIHSRCMISYVIGALLCSGKSWIKCT